MNDYRTAKAVAKANRPAWRKKRYWLGAILAIGLVGSAIGGTDDAEPTADRDAASEVQPSDEAAPSAEAEPATEVEEPVEESAAKEEPKLTAGQENALRSADDYLDYSAFSQSGLVTQLEFDGYSTKDATFAAGHVEADWKAQAARAAKDYLDYSAFSRQGLIDQLKFDGYTEEQATHGANEAGM